MMVGIPELLSTGFPDFFHQQQVPCIYLTSKKDLSGLWIHRNTFDLKTVVIEVISNG